MPFEVPNPTGMSEHGFGGLFTGGGRHRAVALLGSQCDLNDRFWERRLWFSMTCIGARCRAAGLREANGRLQHERSFTPPPLKVVRWVDSGQKHLPRVKVGFLRYVAWNLSVGKRPRLCQKVNVNSCGFDARKPPVSNPSLADVRVHACLRPNARWHAVNHVRQIMRTSSSVRRSSARSMGTTR